MVIEKRAWIRIMEAFVGIMLISTILVFIISKNQNDRVISSEELLERIDRAMEIIRSNETIRNDIMRGDPKEVNNQIRDNIPPNWNFSVRMCRIDDICSNGNVPHGIDVYTNEMIITSNLTVYNTTKIRVFLWRIR